MTCQHPSHLHMTCRRRADDVRMTYVICHLKSPTKSHSRVIRTSSTRRPRVVRASYTRRPWVVRTRLQFPDYFKLNTRGQLC